MFDIAWSKLMLIGAVALVVIGPKDLPGVLRSVGQMVAKLRRMAHEFRSQFDEAIRESEFADVKKSFTDIDDSVRTATSSEFNPLHTIREEVKGAVEAKKGEGAVTPAAPVAEVSVPAPDAPLAITPESFAAPPVAEKPKRKAKTAVAAEPAPVVADVQPAGASKAPKPAKAPQIAKAATVAKPAKAATVAKAAMPAKAAKGRKA